jgi:uncharacterized protein
MMRYTVIAVAAACISWAAHAGEPSSADCHAGTTYRLDSGEVLDIAQSEGDTLRWRKIDGTTGALHKAQGARWTSTMGWTDRADSKAAELADCSQSVIQFDGHRGRRIAFDVTDTKFQGRGVELAGRLVLPKGRGRVPIVVLIHGSERDSALSDYSLQRMLPAEGVGAFVYDKRGTGISGGKYTQDYDTLADDAVAAVREARRLAGKRAGRVGYQGGSAGGWVAPLAATKTSVDFVIVSFGLAVNAIDEDQEEVALEMALKGHTPEDTAKALEVADAVETVIASNMTQGFERFSALREKYKDEPWYKDLHGNFTYILLPMSEAEMQAAARSFDWAPPMHYDPIPTLRAVRSAQLWILGSDDLQAPSAETSRRITALIAEGRPITLAVFPGAEHGMTEFETKPDGERVSTRYSEGYFEMMRDFARNGRLRPRYGRSTITRSAGG